MNDSNSLSTTDSQYTILIVEDEPPISDIYARWLDADYHVRIARTGEEAKSKLGDVDVVLLDRRLPDMAGEELLPDIHERNADCRVAIISTVEPDFDIIELGFDLYIKKPITNPQKLRSAVTTLVQRSQFDSKMQEFLSLASKKATLEATKSSRSLARNTEYQTLHTRVQQLREELQDVTISLDDDDLRVSFR